jgi:error-prone DNA polymerase
MDPFVHLQVASGYSLKYGASAPQRLVERAAEAEMDALALTDRDGVYGAVRFVNACRRRGIRPILGVDLAIEPLARSTTQALRRRRAPARGGSFRDSPSSARPRVTLLAGSKAGWGALCRIISAAHLRGERGSPVTTRDLVAAELGTLADHEVSVLLGPASELGWAATARRDDQARAVLLDWCQVVTPGRLVVALTSHRAPGHLPGASSHAARMAGIAEASGIRTVLTNAVRYADRSDARTVDILDSVRRLVPLDARHLDRANAEGYLKTGKEMAELADEICRMAGFGQRCADQLLARTRSVADLCVIDPRTDLGMGEVHLPELRHGLTDGDAALRDRCEAGIGIRYPPEQRPAVQQRLDAELRMVAGLGYASYFLTVADVVDLIRDLKVRVAARGSGAGSVVNYLLGISGVDPLRYGLVMERFLSPLRRALPDIDLDVESARRTEIYQHILDRYTSARCACVSMMDTYRVRHAVRDVGAALGMPPGEIDSIAKAFPHIRARDARNAVRELPELRGSRLDDHSLDLLFGLVERLDGLPRHIAVHPCGVLISDATLLDRTPVEQSYLGFPMSQFDKDDVEDLGLLKLDVLGIRMQSAMAHAVDEVARVDRIVVDLDDESQVARDDPATFELIQSTRTLGCFQIESPGQRELVGKFAPETFDDIIIDISLFRPGPVKSDMVSPFLRARHGWSSAEYLDPSLEPVLRQTCGVVVFHEQVIEMIAVLTGCGLAEADEARRGLGERESQPDVKAWFYQQALKRGYPQPTVWRCWTVLEAFASFGFCKAHAAAFALPTYQSAWLKAHHPAAFLAGVLTHDPGMYPKRLILDDARQFGIVVLPLDVNASDPVYRVERVDGRYGIRISLADVKGISDVEVERIVAARPFHTLTDLWLRARPSRPVAEHLVLAGGLDTIYGIGSPVPVRRRGRVTRRDLLLQVADLDRWSRATDRARRAVTTAPTSTAVQLTLDLDDIPALSEASGLAEMTAAERVRAELEILGLDVSHHVIDFYAPMLNELRVTWARDLLRPRSRSELLVAGVKVATQTPPIRSGRRVVFVTLDDGTGPVDATFFDDVQEAFATTLFHSWLLVVRGELRRTGPKGVSLRATGCWELPVLHDVWQRGGVQAAADFLRRPAGDSTTAVPRTLWHRSPGSPG